MRLKVFTCFSCSANAISWCSGLKCKRRASVLNMYTIPLYHILSSSCVHYAIVISFNPVFVWIALSMVAGSGQVMSASIIRSGTKGQPWICRLFSVKWDTFGRFCNFRTTCSIFVNLSTTPQGGLPASLSTHPLSHLSFLVNTLFHSETESKILIIVLVSNSIAFFTHLP